jgi:hypothetical protein
VAGGGELLLLVLTPSALAERLPFSTSPDTTLSSTTTSNNSPVSLDGVDEVTMHMIEVCARARARTRIADCDCNSRPCRL